MLVYDKYATEWASMYVSGIPTSEIALKYGCSNMTVLRKIKKVTSLRPARERQKLQSVIDGHKKTADSLKKKNYVNPSEYVNRKILQYGLPFVYVSGYNGNKGGNVTVLCNDCGRQFDVSTASLTHGWGHCPHCARYKSEANRARLEEEKRLKREQKELDRIPIYDTEKEAHVWIKKCPACERDYVSFSIRQKCCSAECGRVLSLKYSSVRKDKRFHGTKRNSSITVKKLYERDRGVCWICGGKCDLNDFAVRDNGTIICGNNYPSVDHIKPVCEGGTDTWDNVKLAHRYCNSARYWSEKKKGTQ